MRWISLQPRMPEQGDRELRKGQRQSEAEHPDEKNSGVPFMNGGDHVRASGQRQCRQETASGRGDLALQPKCCEGVVDGALVIVAALRAETRAASPLVPLAMLRNPLLAAGFAMSALVPTVVMATLMVGPFYLSGALALDAARVGLVMSSGPVAAALTSVPAGRFVDRHGPQRASIVGLVAMAVGAAVLVTRPAAPTSVQASTAAARGGRRKQVPSSWRAAASENESAGFQRVRLATRIGVCKLTLATIVGTGCRASSGNRAWRNEATALACRRSAVLEADWADAAGAWQPSASKTTAMHSEAMVNMI